MRAPPAFPALPVDTHTPPSAPSPPPPPQILHIKEALQEKEGIDVKQIRLIYAGKQLNDTDTVADAKIEAGSTVHMVLSLRGG